MNKINKIKDITVVGNRAVEKRPLLRYMGVAVALGSMLATGCAPKSDERTRVESVRGNTNQTFKSEITCRTASGEVYLSDKSNSVGFRDAGFYTYRSTLNSDIVSVPTANCVVRTKANP